VTTTTNLGVTHIVAAQDQKEVTANAGFERLDAAITELLSVSLASGNASPTAAQVQQAAVIYATGVATSGRTVTLPAVQRPLILECDSGNTHSVAFVRGSTTVTVGAGTRSFVYVDGTTNGLKVIAGAGGTGSGSGDLLAANNLSDVASASSSLTNLGAAASGAVTSSGLTMATARMLGRTTASTGAVEEITVGSGLTLSGGSLTATGAGSGAVTSSGLTMATSRILGRTTASTGAIEEITIGSGLTLSGGSLALSGGGAGSPAGRADDPPAAADFSWVNQGGASVTDRSYGVSFVAPYSTTDNVRILVKSAPSSPYRIIARIKHRIIQVANGFQHAGICFRESSSGKLYLFGPLYRSSTTLHRLAVIKYTNATTYSADLSVGGAYHDPIEWLSIRDDGTSVYFDWGTDGDTWINFASATRAAFFTPDQVGLAINPIITATSTFDTIMTCFSFESA
jgi:hypothetical protein